MSSGSDERGLRDALERTQAALRQEQERAELHKQTSTALQETLRDSERRAAELLAQLAEARDLSDEASRTKLKEALARELGRTTTLLPEVPPAPEANEPGWRFYVLMLGGTMFLFCVYALVQMPEPSPEVLGLAALFGLPALAALLSLLWEWRR